MIVARKLDLGRGWFQTAGAQSDVVISSRIRLGRNIDGHAFGVLLAEPERAELASRLRAVIQGCRDSFYRLELAQDDRLLHSVLLERNLLSASEHGIDEVYVRSDQLCTVVPFDGEHVVLVGIRSGLELRSIHRDLSRLAGRIDRDLPFAVSLHWGYVAADPLASGALMQGSILLHLPALVEQGDPDGALDKARSGAARLELFPSGQANRNGSLANVFQLSNAPNCGLNEEQIIVQLEEAVHGLVHYEREARAQLLQGRRRETTESVERAIGLLRHTPAIGAEEALVLLSWIRLGVALELTEEISIEEVTALLFVSQRCNVMQVSQRPGDEDDRRARLLRDRLASHG